MATLVALSALFTLVIFLFLGVFYIFTALGLSGIAVNEGHKQPFLAWIPIANMYLLGDLVKDDVHEPLREYFPWILTGGTLLAILLGSKISFLGLLPFIGFMYSFYFLAKRYSKSYSSHIILACLTLGIATPFQLFRLRNRPRIGQA